MPNQNLRKPVTSRFAALIFFSRWLQLPLYVGLIFAQILYVIHFFKECAVLFQHGLSLSEYELMLAVLKLIDIVMISNLLIMVIIGGYETFVSRLRLEKHPDEPEWLYHVNPSILKVKLASAIVAISSIHLLATFINAGSSSLQELQWQTLIHVVFIFSALGIAFTERLCQKRAPQSPKFRSFSHD